MTPAAAIGISRIGQPRTVSATAAIAGQHADRHDRERRQAAALSGDRGAVAARRSAPGRRRPPAPWSSPRPRPSAAPGSTGSTSPWPTHQLPIEARDRQHTDREQRPSPGRGSDDATRDPDGERHDRQAREQQPGERGQVVPEVDHRDHRDGAPSRPASGARSPIEPPRPRADDQRHQPPSRSAPADSQTASIDPWLRPLVRGPGVVRPPRQRSPSRAAPAPSTNQIRSTDRARHRSTLAEALAAWDLREPTHRGYGTFVTIRRTVVAPRLARTAPQAR